MSDALRTVVVTGATGFVGRHVVERLLEEDVHVKCIIRKVADADKFDDHERLSFAIGDITKPNTLKRMFKDAWGVVNVAGLREFWTKNRKDFYRLNHIGAENVFRACLENDIQKVVQVSTPLAFGIPKQIPFNESTPAGKHPSDYSESKYLGDQVGFTSTTRTRLAFIDCLFSGCYRCR